MFQDQAKQFLVVTPGGVAIYATPDPYDAAQYASRLGSFQWLAPTAEEIGYDRELLWAANPGRRLLPEAGPSGSPSKASIVSRLPRFMSEQEVMGISLAQAREALLPIFQESSAASVEHARAVSGGQLTDRQAATATVATSLGDWTQPGKGWLGENAKLSKRKGNLAVALGLNLLPEMSVFRLRSRAGVRFAGVEMPEPLVGSTGSATLCQGASAECMATCLVNVGQNAASMRANYSKFAKTKALLERPFEFVRVLVEALRRYEATESPYFGGTDEGVLRFVRLNVLSDIPWEEIAPWLFYRFPRLTFYDYTKVAGRPLMSSRFYGDGSPRLLSGSGHYDLSFSYSGTNAHHCEGEFRRGRRIVQVYVAPGYLVKQRIVDNVKDLASPAVTRALARGKKDPRRIEAVGQVDQVALQAWLKLNPLPTESTIGGRDTRVVRVIDGDETDFRPLDPTNVIVGLRWKPAKVVVDEETGRREELGVGSPGMPKHFVLYGDVVDTNKGPWYRVAESPSSTDGDAAAALAVDFLREARKNTMLRVIGEQWDVHGEGE